MSLSDDNDVKERMVYDLQDVAKMIDSSFPKLLEEDPIGIYLPTQLNPIFIAKVNDDVIEHVTDEKMIASILTKHPDYLTVLFEELKTSNKPFYINGALVKPSIIFSMSLWPHTPIRALELTQDVVRGLVDRHGCYPNSFKTNKSVLKIISEHIAYVYQQDQNYVNECAERVESLLTDLRHDIRTFLGPDRWIMHSVRFKNTDAIIEKRIDYRIMDWTRIQEEKDE